MDTTGATSAQSGRREVAIAVATVLGYLGAALWARQTNLAGPVLVWFPPAGVALAALTFRPRLLPLIMVAEAFSTVVVMGRGADFGAGGLAVNTLVLGIAYAAGAWVLRRLGVDPTLRTAEDVLTVAAGSVVQACIAAPLGVAVQRWVGLVAGDDVLVEIGRFWVGDVVGMTCATPALLLLGARLIEGRPIRRSDRARTGFDPWWFVQVIAPAVIAVALMALTPDEPTRFTYLAFVPVILVAVHHGVVAAAVASALTAVVTTTGAHALVDGAVDGSDLQLLLLTFTLSGIVTGAVVSGRADALARSRRLSEIVESTPDLVATIDRSGIVDYVNPLGRQLLGIDAPPLGATRPDWYLADELAEEVAAEGRRIADERGSWTGPNRLRHTDGRTIEVSEVIIAHRHDDGTSTYSIVCRDMTEQHRLQEQLRRSSLYDGQTQLPNRALLLDHLDRLAESTDDPHPTAVLFVDIDNMGWINERLGFDAGDDVFAELADRLRAQARGTDQVARYGASQFVVILPDVDDELDAYRFALRVRELGAAPVALDQGEVRATVSIGIAVGRTGADHRGVLRNAEIALHRAHEGGGSRVALFDEGLQADARRRLEIEADLQAVLESGAWWLEYQPVVDVAADRIVGVEALLRWTHPERGPVDPFDLVRLAEASGAIVGLGLEVFRRACEQGRRWHDLGLDIGVSVNVSAVQLREPTFVRDVVAVLHDTGIDPHRVTVELTETVAAAGEHGESKTLDELRRRGCRVSIDDFGTGYSSLGGIAGLPVDAVKVDRSFLVDVPESPRALALIDAMRRMAEALDLDIVVEGVETPAQMEALRTLDLRLLQGFALGVPRPADATTELLERDRLRR